MAGGGLTSDRGRFYELVGCPARLRGSIFNMNDLRYRTGQRDVITGLRAEGRPYEPTEGAVFINSNDIRNCPEGRIHESEQRPTRERGAYLNMNALSHRPEGVTAGSMANLRTW